MEVWEPFYFLPKLHFWTRIMLGRGIYDYVSVRLVRKSFDGILNYQLKSTISSKDRKHLRKSLSIQKLSASKDQPITKTLGRSRLTKRGIQSVFCLSELSDPKSQTGSS